MFLALVLTMICKKKTIKYCIFLPGKFLVFEQKIQENTTKIAVLSQLPNDRGKMSPFRQRGKTNL
jgi:hypothetical protein